MMFGLGIGDQEMWLLAAALVVLILGCISWGQPRVINRVWHWHYLTAGLQETPDHFYAQVYQRLEEGIQVRHLPLSGLGFGPSRLFENRTILGGQHLYLQARYKHASIYLYVAQTPNGLFISQWLFSRHHNLLGHPILRWTLLPYIYGQTLFQFDSVLMFGESFHSIVLDVLDGYIQEHGLKPMEEFERRPVLHSFYGGIAAGYGTPSGYGTGAGQDTPSGPGVAVGQGAPPQPSAAGGAARRLPL
jgi:hypothetical protein